MTNCLIESYKAKDVDIITELKKIENYLIKKGRIESSTSQSYYNLYKKIASCNEYSTTINYEKCKDMFKLDYYKLDTDIILKSKHMILYKQLSEYKKNNITNTSGKAKITTSVLKPCDFDQTYFRYMALLTIAYISLPERANTKDTASSINKNNKNILIKATEDKNIILNGIKIKNLLEEVISKHNIILSTEPKTPYSFYIQLQINIVYLNLRNKQSRFLFKKDFNNIDKEKQELIQQKTPINIREATKQ